MSEVEIAKIICLLFVGVLLMLVVIVIAWAKGYKDGAEETREFYIHFKNSDEELSSSENPTGEDVKNDKRSYT